ncbi:MAG: hypothetical protein KatS3mg126_0356 [Lysobacteraceae bacterium]|nr:MAG: hypothetical protein KatS3mg126_0356 [Xanthomonadaceae bacterium]
MIRIQLELYGACRDLHSQDRVEIDLPEGSTVADLRERLPAAFDRADPQRAAELVRCSAFATDAALLRDADPLPGNGSLAILPPVSGG